MRRPLCMVLFGIALGGEAHARTELLKTQPGSVVHWSRAEITVGVDASARSRTVSAEGVVRALAGALQTWNEVRAEQPRFRTATGPSPDVSIRFCRGRWQGDTIDLGRSKFNASLRDGTVTAATVEINECDHAFVPPERGSGYDLQAVLTHELGHVLGLGHSDNRSAIMFPSGGGASVRAPQLEDQTALALIYLGRTSMEAAGHIALHPSGEDAASAPRATVDESLRRGAPPHPHGDSAPPGASKSESPPSPDMVSLLSFKTRNGRSVTVFTCEPTLLPPIESASAKPGAPRERRPRKAGHGPTH
jgi:predicted Zn-dependent protease